MRCSTTTTSPFSLPNTPPRVSVTAPTDGRRVTGAQTVVFGASIHDSEDGALDGAQVQWSSDRDGTIGEGARLTRRADLLSEGAHVITVRATDADGAGTSAQVSIHVQRVAEPEGPEADVTFGRFLSPVSEGDVNATNAGRTIPVKWTVLGEDVTDGSVTEATFTTPGATYALTRTGATWQLNAQTPKDWEGSTQVFRVVLTTGEVHEVRFQFHEAAPRHRGAAARLGGGHGVPAGRADRRGLRLRTRA